jgi:hypothetical protein
MPSPQVLDGMRAPRSVRLDDIRKSTEAANALPTPTALAPEGVTVYISAIRRYLVEVQNTPSYVHEGRRYPAKRIAAQFEDGVYRNDHRDPAVRKLVDEALQSNPYFGRFGGGPKVHFWLANDQFKTTEAARVEAALKTLKSLPKDVVDGYIAELKQGEAADHDMNEIAANAEAVRAQRPIKPIPTSAQ